MKTHIDYQRLTNLFESAADAGRDYLFEYEVYRFIELIGGETPPEYYMLNREERIDSKKLDAIPGEKVVIKVISPYILHKSDVGGVAICSKTERDVLSTVRQMSCEIPDRFAENLAQQPEVAPEAYAQLSGKKLKNQITCDIKGYLICQYMEPDSHEFGNELLVSLRNSREFGMVISAGLGGRDTELYAARFKKGQAVVSSSTDRVDGKGFFTLFQKTISYKKLAGLTRGQKRIVTDHQLQECFEALTQVARHYSSQNQDSDFVIEELEVNPFAFSNFLMMPLDGLCRFSKKKHIYPERPLTNIDKLLHPKSIGIIGISAQKINIGRIVLDNILTNGYPLDQLTLFHPTAGSINSIETTRDLSSLSTQLDLLIVAVDSSQVADITRLILRKDLAASIILISGGFGENSSEENEADIIYKMIRDNHQQSNNGPVFLGANSLGVLSHPGQYDAMFIPDSKLPKKRGTYRRNVALVSQSGAYMITRMSKLAFLDPAYAISIGNQIDLTTGDFLHYLNMQEEISTLAFYVEGFNDLDGLRFVEAVEIAISRGKDVIFYKAGRTPEGKDALSGHTSSIAGDYMVCESSVSQAGAIVAETFNMFEGLLKLSATLHDKTIRGNRLAAVSNAGYEAVGIADNILGEDYRLEMGDLTLSSQEKLHSILESAKLSALTTVSNPLDITPMAPETVYLEVIQTLLADSSIDGVIAAIVPLTPMLQTLPNELQHGQHQTKDSVFVKQIGLLNSNSDKPLVIVVDSGKLYDTLAERFEQENLPVFRSADLAVSGLGKYMVNRLNHKAQ